MSQDRYAQRGVSSQKEDVHNAIKNIDKEEVPSNFTSFYNNYIDEEKTELTNIKINNKILHQSKLINY